MNNLGFYTWLREGVRRAVLLGVSDAIEQMGTPTETDDISPHLLQVLRQTTPRLAEAPKPAEPAAPTTGRRRLGRSLDQLNRSNSPEPAAAETTAD